MNRFTRRAPIIAVGLGITALLAVTGCTAGDGSADDQVVITLAGPNQWNTESSTFGDAWEGLIERFEAEEPGIKVETTVLPLTSFRDTLSTQLASGTAPDLIFSQVPHDPSQVHSLDEYLDQPNPYVEGNESWLDIFNSNYFGDNQRNAAGNFEQVPLNAVIAGVFYNKDAFDDAGIDEAPGSISELIDACGRLSDAGYTPLAMDSGSLGIGWTSETIYDMLLTKYVPEWDQYTSAGEPGDNNGVLTQKSIARAISTGELSALDTPEIAEAVEITKTIWDACATPNWSGIPGSATFVGADEFLSGEAAMAWGTSFASGNLADVDWAWSSMPFPTITEQDSDLTTGVAARFGASAGGTNYMIPTTTTDAELDAAIKFLQYASSPAGGQQWLDETGAIPVTVDADPAPGLEQLVATEWAEPKEVQLHYRSNASAGKNLLEGYLLGSKTLQEQLESLQSEWTTWAKETAETAGWTEDWVLN